jgi:hypothetical protein
MNELDEATQSYSGYTSAIGLARFSNIWQGYLMPPSRGLHRGIRAPRHGKKYRGDTRGTTISRCFPR